MKFIREGWIDDQKNLNENFLIGTIYLEFFSSFSYNFLLVIRPIQVKFSYARKLLNLIYSETKPQTKKIIFFFPRLISESSILKDSLFVLEFDIIRVFFKIVRP